MLLLCFIENKIQNKYQTELNRVHKQDPSKKGVSPIKI
jgi:hypothetical protein